MSPGRLLGGRYEVGELLGYGGMAEVHHGRDMRLGRDVAIKMLRADLARDATFQLRFSREAQNAAALNHPAIVAVYDTGEERGPVGEPLPYIVMEFVNGRTLKEILTAEGPLQPRRALEISADICAALEFSHRHGIIHRDIKPGNVMMTRTGQVKVMDFGIARALASGASTMTQTSAVIGTAQYLSPEQARGEAVDARSDVYATGCVVYELLTGRPPFVGDNPVSVAYQHVREDAKPPSTINRDVAPDVDAIVLKALSKNPLNRYQSAAEMRSDLLRAAAGRPVMATPVQRQETTRIIATPPRVGPNGPRPTMPARVGNPQRRRASTFVMVALTLLGVLAVLALGIGLYLTNRPHNTTVPNLVGQNISDAGTLLQQSKLTLGTQIEVHSDKCNPGNILTTAPAAGKVVREQDQVDVTFCAGPDQVSGGVPVVVGLTQKQAEDALRNDHLTWTIQNVSSDKPQGIVTAVDPPAGTKINMGGKVTLSVSKGDLAVLPDVTGKSSDDAQQTLKDKGFSNVKVIPNMAADPADIGKVTQQNPQASDNPIPKSQQILIYVGAEPTGPPSPSPSVSPS